MQVADLWHEIKRLWPKSFLSEDHERMWASKTHGLIAPYAGETLAAAWQNLLSEYQKTAWPGPALILEHCRRVHQARGPIGSGGMGQLPWAQYRAWLQFTRRLSSNLQPFPEQKMAELLANIPDEEMVRLGTPREAPNRM